MKYTAINIGPVVSTLQMARKPRELWAASYLFSFLMECIINVLQDYGIKKADIISPDILDKSKKENQNLGVGLYPDRIFFKNSLQETLNEQSFIEDVFEKFISSTKFVVEKNDGNVEKKLKRDFFKMMIVSLDISIEQGENEESKAIQELNQALDKLELFNIASKDAEAKTVRDLIRLKYGSPLFIEAFGKKKFPVESLGEIAAKQMEKLEPEKWKKFAEDIKSEDNKIAEKAYSQFSEKNLKSYHKYICIVQADGDNVGTTVSHKKLQDGKVKEISTALLDFGKKATKKIKKYGGLPIYAGGDDLLFIAPVVGIEKKEDGSWKNILDLLEELNDDSFKGVIDKVAECKLTKDDKSKKTSDIDNTSTSEDCDQNKDKEDILIEASLSFGISITYYKYPLYEALGAAGKLLFDVAKKIEDKKAWAWSLRKHSGSSFDVAFSRKDKELTKAFFDLINATTDDDLVSAVAHKLYEKDELSNMVLKSGSEARLNALFGNILEFKDNPYFNTVKKLMPVLYNTEKADKDEKDERADKTNKSDNYATKLYSLLRTAKFIKGEELRDE